jgi:glycogen phosphorylase
MDRYVPLPPLPPRLARLNELAYDLWWSWNSVAREVFRDLDYPLWRFTDHNPVLLLHLVEQERLEHAAADAEFLRLYDEAIAALDSVRAGAGTWWSRRGPDAAAPIAFVAPRFWLHQALPLDDDGAAVAAGDYCKEASDLGVPLVGVGLMYARGYMHQRLSGEGWQQESFEYLDWSDAPIGPALRNDGTRCTFPVALVGGTVQVIVWLVRAGRVTLFLLDTDVRDNAPWDRSLSSATFLDDSDALARQSILLGAGAARALELMGLEPSVWHLHDGASAFVALERLQAMLGRGLTLDDALAQIRETTVYTSRRAAGAAPRVTFETIERHANACWPALVDARREVLALGQVEFDRGASFSGAVLGEEIAGAVNVPRVAKTSRSTPAETMTAGVHVPSWIAREIAALIERYVGDDWRDHQDDAPWWNAVATIPDEHLWNARQRLRAYLVDFVRERARKRWGREQASGTRLVALGTLLDPSTLTIGFARRFTEDLRADLIFSDAPRLASILTASRRPVQLVFAGRAHPGNEAGKHHLQRVFGRALDPVFAGRIAFLEDYDLHAARLLVQGCDVWLSTAAADALPPLGALKAAMNGAPHLRTPAAQWRDASVSLAGWTADGGRASDSTAQDAADARAVYRLLEEEIVPAFYERDRSGIPTRWLQHVRSAIVTGIPHFCARRAVKTAVGSLYRGSQVLRF